MWMFKSFSGKEQAGLEGRVIEIGNTKIRVQSAIAEGGFSCVYLAHDSVNASKHYALKHMICQDGESLDLVIKEIQVMKVLKGHPNVVTLVAHSILDIGRRKEALLLLEFYEKSLVNVLESRGAEYFEENEILLIFRDVCNAVFAMHSQSPPIAHRDLKAENVLLGSEGAWRLCDFGSTSTKHKCFDRPEEMGIEEDNIRKHTTPAYRAPEMWDLYKREVICEKVDIWALGCLLYRICYFKSAFDGEPKLQILNGNYRIPELPKYSDNVTGLIKSMLEGSPGARPDITQVWFRVNQLLPVELQKHLPNCVETASTVTMHPPISDVHYKGTLNRTHVTPKRGPPPPPTLREKIGNEEYQTRPSHGSPMANLGRRISPPVEQRFWPTKVSAYKVGEDGQFKDLETRFSAENKSTFQNESFNAFVADFDSNIPISGKTAIGNSINKSKREEELEEEVERLKEQLKQVNLEKTEVTFKIEKLSAICRSQRQEIQEMKLTLVTSTPPSAKDFPQNPGCFSGSSKFDTPSRERIEGTVLEPQQGILSSSTSLYPDPKPWKAFPDEPKPQLMPNTKHSKSVGTNNDRRSSTKHPGSSSTRDDWGFGYVSFTAPPSSSSDTFRSPVLGSSSQRFSAADVKKVESSQPAGWAGF